MIMIEKPRIHLSTSPGQVAPSRLGALVRKALRPKKNRLGLPLEAIHEQLRTFDQERTHSRSAVGFNLRFGLVTVENPGIDHKIMGVA